MGQTGVGFSADPGESNDVTLQPIAGGYEIRDTGAEIRAAEGNESCSISDDRHSAVCMGPPPQVLIVSLGDGNDRATVTAPVTGSLETGPDTGVSGGEGNDVLSATSYLVRLNGDAGNDELHAVGEHASLWGDAGDDTLTGAAAQSMYYGGDGNDVLNGDSTHPQPPQCAFMETNDWMEAGPGDDTLNGGAGLDRLEGGPGGDTLDAGPGCDVLFGDAYEPSIGPDATDGHAGADRLLGGDDSDRLFGGPGDDILEGGDGLDALSGGFGSDSMSGGPGNDGVLYARIAPVTASLAGGAGNGEAGENDVIAADVEGLAGGGGDDRLTGNGGENDLSGNGGNDVLDGAGGFSDYLTGGTGNDLLIASDTPAQPAPGQLQDDAVDCDSGLRSGDDVAVIDRYDSPAVWPTGAHSCESVLFTPFAVTVSPDQSSVSVTPTCPVALERCSGDVVLRVRRDRPTARALSAGARWKGVGRRNFARVKGRGRKVKVRVSRRAVRSLRRRGRVRAFVTFSYTKQRRR